MKIFKQSLSVYKIFFLSVFCFLISCNTCEWVSSDPLAYPVDAIWNTSYQVLSKRYDILKASKGKKEIETEWRKQMSVHYLEGFRDKIFMKIEEYDASIDASDLSKPIQLDEEDTINQKQYTVKLCVERQQNRDMDNPMAPSAAEWYHSGYNFEEANLILSFIITRLNLMYPKVQ